MPKTRNPKKQWTVMVYMVAGDNAELDGVAVEDIREMEGGVGLNANNVHVVVQINRAWPDSAQRYAIRKRSKAERSNDDSHRGISVPVGPPNGSVTNMGERKTLTEFVKWAAPEYPADHYFLVLWGHAYGLGFGRDHNEKLTLDDLKSALTAFRRARPKTKGHKTKQSLELLGANACAMSYAEAIYQLRNSAQFMVASQIAVPFAGWPYESILRRVTGRTDPQGLGKLVVDSYVSHFNALPSGARVTMTLLNLERAKKLQALVRSLARGIERAVSPREGFNHDKLAQVRDVFIGTATGEVRPLIDLKELCNVLDETDLSGGLQKVKETLDELLPANPVDPSKSDSSSGRQTVKKDLRLVVDHDCHPTLKDSLHGVGIYAPFVTDEKDLKRLELARSNGDALPKGKKTGRQEYEALDLFKGENSKLWPRLVYDGLRREIPSELMTRIQDIGVMNRFERAELAQIILAIDSSFNILDRMMTSTKKEVVSRLRALGQPNGTQKSKQKASNGTRKSTQKAPAEPTKRFGLPWLQLATSNLIEKDAHVAKIEYQSRGPVSPAMVQVAQVDAESVTTVIEEFEKLEKVVKRVERATRKGLTNARFGLGPSGLEQVGFFIEGPRDSATRPPQEGALDGGDDNPKGAGDPLGPPNGALPVRISAGGALRGDLALARVQDLFGQVGQSLKTMEQALAQVELTASVTLTDSTQREGLSQKDYFDAAEKRIARAFRILEESSTTARRTVRWALHHPIYGLGPGPHSLGLDEREELARAGGLDGRNLQLL